MTWVDLGVEGKGVWEKGPGTLFLSVPWAQNNGSRDLPFSNACLKYTGSTHLLTCSYNFKCLFRLLQNCIVSCYSWFDPPCSDAASTYALFCSFVQTIDLIDWLRCRKSYYRAVNYITVTVKHALTLLPICDLWEKNLRIFLGFGTGNTFLVLKYLKYLKSKINDFVESINIFSSSFKVLSEKDILYALI